MRTRFLRTHPLIRVVVVVCGLNKGKSYPGGIEVQWTRRRGQNSGGRGHKTTPAPGHPGDAPASTSREKGEAALDAEAAPQNDNARSGLDQRGVGQGGKREKGPRARRRTRSQNDARCRPAAPHMVSMAKQKGKIVLSTKEDWVDESKLEEARRGQRKPLSHEQCWCIIVENRGTAWH